MKAHPYRVQRSRAKGSSLPPDVIYAGRPGVLGNPFTVDGCRDAGYIGTDEAIHQRCVEAFKLWLGPYWRNNWDGDESEYRRSRVLRYIETGHMVYRGQLTDIRGKRLACWCGLDQECHVDALLELLQRRWPEFYSEGKGTR